MTFEKLSNGETRVKIRGVYDAFPALEIIVNGNVVAEYYPEDPRPTLLNLGGTYSVNVAIDLLILPPDRRSGENE